MNLAPTTMSSSSAPELVSTLEHACSQSGGPEVRAAEQQLKEWENQPGFYSAILAVVNNYPLSTPVRWQAVLYFKNGVDRYWRSVAQNAISDDEKVVIRGNLLQCFNEPIQPIALQIAVLIGKVARFDVPRHWPELVPGLLDAIQSESDLVQHRALLAMHHTVKALASKRLTSDRRLFHDMINQLLPYVLQIWQVHHTALVQQLNCSSSTAALPLEKAILSMKVLRKAIGHGLKKPHENADAMLFLNNLLEQTKILLNFRLEYPRLREALEKYLVLQLKVLTDLLEMHPYSFLPLLHKTLDFICSVCFHGGGQSAKGGGAKCPGGVTVLFQRFSIYCLNLLKQVLLCAEYKPSKHAEDSEQPLTLEGQRIKKAFFTTETVTEICKRMISQYLPLSQDDLSLWDADAEEYACEDGGDSWKYSYRPCCETAFLTVFHEHRDILTSTLVGLARDNSRPVAPEDLAAILYKDAVYNAVGLAAFDLYDEIDFDQWLVSGLEAELSVNDSNYRIVRRRVVWLLGQWSGVKLSPELRPRLYQLLLPLLQPSEDLVVRLATAKALKVVIDDFEFSSVELEPFLGVAFDQLFLLLKEVQECDTKLSVLNVLSFLIERVGVSIRPFCNELLQYLPALWDASADHNMLRCSILTTLVFIVQGLGTISSTLSPFLFPVIQMSTDLKEPSSVYLLEDGLELWLTVLHNAKQMSPEIGQLAKNIPPLLELGSENLRTMIYILQAYLLLSPTDFLLTTGEAVNKVLQSQYADLQDEGVLMILRLVDLALKVGPPQTPNIFQSLVLCSVRAIYDGEHYPLLMSLHLSIASRLLLASPAVFNQFCVQLAQELGKPHAEVAGRVLDVWLDKMGQVTQPEGKKLLSLSLASLLTSGSPVVLDRVFAIFVNLTETLNDITKQSEETGAIVDTMLKSVIDLSCDGDDPDYETEHDCRRRQALAGDPVHTVNLRDYFQQQVAGLAEQLGQNRYADLISHVDVETLANMKEFIAL